MLSDGLKFTRLDTVPEESQLLDGYVTSAVVEIPPESCNRMVVVSGGECVEYDRVDGRWQKCDGLDVPSNVTLVEAGVDPSHQTSRCDHCGKVFADPNDVCQTCSHTGPLTLCDGCYRKAGNSVR